jgi:PAS domain S-box-containing protein
VVVIQNDEVGELAAAFNEMADQLQHTLAGHQQKIIELEKMGAALQSSEIRYRTIFENAQEGIYRATPEGQFILVNPALVKMLGYNTAAELMNLNITYDLYKNAADRQAIIKRLAQEGRITHVETVWKRKDGSAIVVSLSTHVLYDNQQQIIGFEGLIFDMSRRREMEQERESLIAELEAKNAELERFTYTVSHDLKSPLITIRGYLGYLEKGVKSGNLERFESDMSRIVEATHKMQRLLAELLQLSRIGRKMNPPETLSFQEIIAEAMSLVEGQLVSRGVRVHIEPDLPLVRGDRARLVEVLQNLVDNASKYMGEQANPQIVIGHQVKNGNPIFFVRDNGCGIAPQYHEKIFGLFDKLNPQSEGTGVGLALVKRIIEIHNGRIWVESTGLGHGSTFFFTLPPAE